MHRHDQATRSAAEILERFFLLERGRASGRRLQRLELAERDLRSCLDAEADAILTETELALLAAEIQFDPEGATARVTEPDAILHVLPPFLQDPAWHGQDAEDRRLRIRLALPLARLVCRLPELRRAEVNCAFWDVEAAVDRGRRDLRRSRAPRVP